MNTYRDIHWEKLPTILKFERNRRIDAWSMTVRVEKSELGRDKSLIHDFEN